MEALFFLEAKMLLDNNSLFNEPWNKRLVALKYDEILDNLVISKRQKKQKNKENWRARENAIRIIGLMNYRKKTIKLIVPGLNDEPDIPDNDA